MFYTLLTHIGKAKLANATALGTTVQLTHIAVGDGNGAAIIPVDTATVLTHEVWRSALNSIAVDPANTNWIVAEGYIPSTSGGFTVREVGLFDIDGDLIAIGSYPDTYKPTLAAGSAKDLYIKVIIEVTNSSTVTLKIDPAVVLSTRSYVDSKVVEHEAKADPHSQYLTIDKIHAAPFESTLGGNDEWAIWDSFTGLLRKISVTGFISYLASIFVQPSQLFGFKNYIINGNFDVWQYGTSQTTAGYGSDDRWINYNLGSTKTHQRVVTDSIIGANFCSRTIINSVSGASNSVSKYQYIEDVTKLAGKTVTLSFWAKADSSRKIAIQFGQRFGTGGAPSAQVTLGANVITLTSNWSKYTVTVNIPSISGKTLGTDGVNTSSTWLQFFFEAGSSFGFTGMTQQSGTVDMAQIQLEEGNIATPFENRPYGLELSLCQRYYWRSKAPASGWVTLGNGFQYNGLVSYTFIKFPTPMRVPPTFSYGTVLTDFSLNYSPGGVTPLSIVTNNVTQEAATLSVGATLVAGYSTQLITTNANAYLAFSAEL